jgi:iron(III) transport system substrate-binding protein
MTDKLPITDRRRCRTGTSGLSVLRTRILVLSLFFVSLVNSHAIRANAATVEPLKKESTVVFYSSMTAEHHEALVKAFNRKHSDLKVEGYRSNSIRVLNRVLTEGRAGNHLVDVINVNELNAWVLRDKGLLQAHKSTETEAYPKEFRDPAGLLLCCADVLTSDMAYNTKLVRKNEAPKSYHDLLLPVWKGKIGMENDMAELFAALIAIWGKDKTVNYFKALMAQGPSMRRGRTLLAQLLAMGEFSVALGFYGYRVLELKDEGAPLEIIQADPVVAWPRRLLFAKNAPHPNAGRVFIDYVLSEEGQRLLAQLGRTVVRPGIEIKHPRLVRGVKLHPVPPEVAKDFETVSKLYYEIVK